MAETGHSPELIQANARLKQGQKAQAGASPQPESRPAPVEVGQEEDWTCEAEKALPKIPAGEYQALVIQSKKKTYRFNRKEREKIEFRFKIFSGEFDGIELRGYCPYYKKAGTSTKLYRWAVLAMGARADRISPLPFRGKLFKVLVDFTPKFIPNTHTPAPKSIQHSEVIEILELLAGGRP